MKITSHMLSRFMNVPHNLFEVTNQSIIEVESFKKYVDATNLVIGHVLTCEKHENADTLFVTTVDIGSEILQIVCGAANVAKGQYVIVSKVGAILPGGFEIKKAKIRGVESQGMICSLNELGFEEKFIPDIYKDGIFYYQQPVTIGNDPLVALGLEGDVIELSLTPNRSDLLSVYGYAKDLCAILDQSFKSPKINYTKVTSKNPIKVNTKTKANPIYYAACVSDVKIKPSPWWLKSALIANEIKPINNVVDISNYVMLEYGTPLHMFDRDKVKTDEIIVRQAKEGESVVTLDEVERKLHKEDIVITNGKDVIAIGGVMGCLNTEIDSNSKNVIIEAAYFDPKHIQKTSRKLGLRSDSSLRFERGVDPDSVIVGLSRAVELLVELADAKVYDGIAEDVDFKPVNPEIKLTTKEINEALDISLDDQMLFGYLKRFEYDINQKEDVFYVKAPSYRNDILISADVIEEVARMYGLNNIETKRHPVNQKGQLTHKQKRIRYLRHTLSKKGFYEVITYSLTSMNDLNRFASIGEPVHILSPLSEERKYLRQSLMGGLLGTIRYNQSRQIEDVSIFEVGKVFAKDIETLKLGIALTGKLYASGWQNQNVESDFYLLKGILDALLKPLGVSLAYKATQQFEYLHPHQQANIFYDDQVIGHIGQIHPRVCDVYDISKTFACEIDLTSLVNLATSVSYEAVSKYPNITRDLAILVDDHIESNTITQIIEQTGRPYLTDVEIFDVYKGNNMDTNKKSIAFRMVFNNPEKTLTTEDVDKIMKKISNRLEYSFKAIIRS
jgi:phenylalanyl-tRNA synthetase beta chain